MINLYAVQTENKPARQLRGFMTERKSNEQIAAELVAAWKADIGQVVKYERMESEIAVALADRIEECCVAVCFACQNPEIYGVAAPGIDNTWTHLNANNEEAVCRATDIRALSY